MKKKKNNNNIRTKTLFFSFVITLIVMLMLTFPSLVFAGEDTGGDTGGSTTADWDAIIGTVSTWVTRLGGVVLALGGVMFGLGWKNDDADSKTRGLQTMIAGGVVTAMATYFK